MIKLILRAIAMGSSVASIVLLIIGGISEKSTLMLISIGLFSLTLSVFHDDKDKK